MGGSNSKKLRALVYLAMLLFLGWSTFSLMGDESQRPIQLGFGLGYITYALFAINKRIIFLTKIKIPKIRLYKMKRDFNFFFGTFFVIFALFSSFIFILAGKEIVNTPMSSIWLLGVIFIF